MSSKYVAVPCALLVLLAACRREGAGPGAPATPSAPATTASASDAAPAMSVTSPAAAASVAAPQPADASLAHYDGYGDLRFGMSAAQAAQAWGGELKAVPAASEPCHYLTPT